MMMRISAVMALLFGAAGVYFNGASKLDARFVEEWREKIQSESEGFRRYYADVRERGEKYLWLSVQCWISAFARVLYFICALAGFPYGAAAGIVIFIPAPLLAVMGVKIFLSKKHNGKE